MPTISGRSNLPDDSQPLVGEWKIGLAAGTVDDGDGTWRGGVRVFSTDDAGNLTVTLPATRTGEAYTAEFTSRRGPKVNVPRFTFELTGDRTWADIIEHPSIPPITPSNVAQVEADRAAVAADRAAVEAIGTTTDTVIAGRINAPASATSGALNTKMALSDSQGRQVLKLTYRNGWVANRVSLGGIYDPAANGVVQLAPFFEVTPALPAFRPIEDGGTWVPANDPQGAQAITDPTGNDVDPVSGYQLYRVGNGDTNVREFLAIEAFGAGQCYKIITAVSGGGIHRPIQIAAGAIARGLVVETDGSITIERELKVRLSDAEVKATFVANKAFPALVVHQVENDADAPTIQLLKNRGSEDTPAPPQSGDILGDIRAGYKSSPSTNTPYTGGTWRMLATQTWVPGTAHGTKAQVRVTGNGFTGSQTGLEIDVPVASLDTSATLLVNRGGAITSNRVLIGAADSGGAGFRMLRVAN